MCCERRNETKKKQHNNRKTNSLWLRRATIYRDKSVWSNIIIFLMRNDESTFKHCDLRTIHTLQNGCVAQALCHTIGSVCFVCVVSVWFHLHQNMRIQLVHGQKIRFVDWFGWYGINNIIKCHKYRVKELVSILLAAIIISIKTTFLSIYRSLSAKDFFFEKSTMCAHIFLRPSLVLSVLPHMIIFFFVSFAHFQVF